MTKLLGVIALTAALAGPAVGMTPKQLQKITRRWVKRLGVDGLVIPFFVASDQFSDDIMGFSRWDSKTHNMLIMVLDDEAYRQRHWLSDQKLIDADQSDTICHELVHRKLDDWGLSTGDKEDDESTVNAIVKMLIVPKKESHGSSKRSSKK